MIEIPFFPEQASTIAWQVDLLTVVLLGLGGFFSSIVFALIFYFGVRYRRGRVIDRSSPPTTSMRVELSWIVLLLLLGMTVYAVAAVIYLNISRTDYPAMEVYVLGRQWMWEMQHPDGPREINELHVPVDTPVRLIMTSQDVIHSFYVPAFRLKYDVIPGRYTTMSFEANKPGEYHLFCTEYCGTLHAGMIGQVIVMEQRDYQEWLAAQTQTVAVSMPQAGRQVYEEMACGSCHDGGTSVRAPQLAGRFGDPVLLEDGSKVVFDENYFRESVLLPLRRVAAGYDPIMPTYQDQVSEEQLQQLIAYFKTLKAEPDTADQGGES